MSVKLGVIQYNIIYIYVYWANIQLVYVGSLRLAPISVLDAQHRLKVVFLAVLHHIVCILVVKHSL